MKENALSATHNSALDYIRIVATILVVLNHSVEEIYHFNLIYIDSLPTLIKWFCFGVFTLGRIGVPLFLMLSGYLLLHRTYDYKETILFYKKNVYPLLLTWEIWILIYSIFLSYYNHVPFDVWSYILRALFLQHADMTHSWYMPMIIGIYLFIPCISEILKRVPDKMILSLMLITYIYCFIVPSINIFVECLTGISLSTQLDLNYSGGTYGIYLLLGYFARKWNDKIAKCKRFSLHRKHFRRMI